jgi:TonB-dependent starch-binding outer membrane protein SusC
MKITNAKRSPYLKWVAFSLFFITLTFMPPSLFAASPPTLFFQKDITIAGKIIDATTSEPIIGASIVVKGTTKGAITDDNGAFSLLVPDDAVLVVSFVGYQTQEIPVGTTTNFTISLAPDAKLLDEFVKVGYGEIKKSDLTGAVSKLNYAETSVQPVTSIDQYIQGRVSGVQITQNTGAPGAGMSFLIRGAASVTGSNQPLIILDGFPIETGSNSLSANGFVSGDFSRSAPPTNPLAAINPNDIESIEILKDASSTAIYGSRGANGVVLITTKKGNAKKDQINYTFRFDNSRLPRKIDLLNTEDFINYANEARFNNGLDTAYRPAEIAAVIGNNYNWQDLIYQEALSQEHQLSASGGDDRTTYMVSGNYANQIGIVKNSYFTRAGVRANLNRKINQRFQLSANISGTYNINRSAQQTNQNGSPQGSVITGALTFRPLVTPFANDDQSEPNLTADNNPLTLIQNGKNLSISQVILANVRGDYKLTKELTFSSTFGANYNNAERNAFLPAGTGQGTLSNGYAFYGQNNNINYLAENTLNFNHTFKNKHRISAVAGYSYQKFFNRSLVMSATNFSSQLLGFDQLNLANATSIPATSNQNYSLSSFIGRVNYAIKDRYLVTFTGRSDGASRLPEGNKWAFFPSAAIGWNVHKEGFFKGIKSINELKFRASYGITGNQNVGLYAPFSRVQVQRAVTNGNVVSGLAQSTLANTDARWETTNQWNAGVDLSFFESRLKFGFELYNRKTTDLIISLALPTSSGFASYNGNNGSIENKGYEFDLKGVILDKKFKWDAIANYSVNKNKITALGNDVQIFGENFYAQYSIQQPITTALIGYPVGSFFGYKLDGIYQTKEEIAAGPKVTGTVLPGDFKFKDVNGDGSITTADRTIIGNPNPDFTFGLTNNFAYKNLSLSVFVMGIVGQDVANMNRFTLDGMNYLTLSNIRREAYENRWRGAGTSNFYPAPRGATSPAYTTFSDFLIEDASFVRLKNVTLAYDLPTKAVKWLRSAKVFVTGTNLFTLTDYKGYDPEVNGSPNPNTTNALNFGIDMGTIPQYRTISAGVSVGF